MVEKWYFTLVLFPNNELFYIFKIVWSWVEPCYKTFSWYFSLNSFLRQPSTPFCWKTFTLSYRSPFGSTVPFKVFVVCVVLVKSERTQWNKLDGLEQFLAKNLNCAQRYGFRQISVRSFCPCFSCCRCCSFFFWVPFSAVKKGK